MAETDVELGVALDDDAVDEDDDVDDLLLLQPVAAAAITETAANTATANTTIFPMLSTRHSWPLQASAKR